VSFIAIMYLGYLVTFHWDDQKKWDRVERLLGLGS
jgi:hypothetical protein